MKIDFRLPEAYLAQLRPGLVIEVTPDALPGQRFEAVLDAINPLVDTGGRAISCRARLSNSDVKLRPGMFVRVRLILEARSNVLLVPEQSIVPDMKSPYVYRVIDGKAQPAPVVTGLRRAGMVEVVSGLAVGDEVVTAGQIKLRPGAAVMALPRQSAPEAGSGAPPASASPAAGETGTGKGQGGTAPNDGAVAPGRVQGKAEVGK